MNVVVLQKTPQQGALVKTLINSMNINEEFTKKLLRSFLIHHICINCWFPVCKFIFNVRKKEPAKLLVDYPTVPPLRPPPPPPPPPPQLFTLPAYLVFLFSNIVFF